MIGNRSLEARGYFPIFGDVPSKVRQIGESAMAVVQNTFHSTVQNIGFHEPQLIADIRALSGLTTPSDRNTLRRELSVRLASSVKDETLDIAIKDRARKHISEITRGLLFPRASRLEITIGLNSPQKGSFYPDSKGKPSYFINPKS